MMLENSWSGFHFICGNHDTEEHELYLKEGRDVFYACPEYRSIYGSRHDGRSCNNRLSVKDCSEMVIHMTEQLYADKGIIRNLLGYSYKKRGIEYTVVRQEKDGELWIRVLNTKAIRP